MSKIFNFEDGVLNAKIGTKNQVQQEEKTNAANAAEELKKHQKVMEHMTGFYDLIFFVSKMKKMGAKIEIDKNIIKLDSIASNYFYMIPSFTHKYKIFKKGKPENKIVEYNPSITCIYDFIHLIDWEICYIYNDYMYLVAPPKTSDTEQLNNIRHFILAVQCNMPEKFNIFQKKSYVDFRKIKFNIIEDEVYDDDDELIEQIQMAKMTVEENYVEKTIKCMILDERTKYLINNHNSKLMEQEHQTYNKLINSPQGEQIGKFLKQFNGAYQFYDISTETPESMIRDFDAEHAALKEKIKNDPNFGR